MASLKAVLDSIDDLADPIKELYSKKGDKFELTGIEGVKTTADVERVNKTNNTLREENKTLKAKLAPFADLDIEEVTAKLDRIEELEAAASGKMDDAAINKLVEARLKTQLGPKDREVKRLLDENAALKSENDTLKTSEKRRAIHDAVRTAALELKLVDTAIEDALYMSERFMDVDDDGRVGTKEGATPKDWLLELQPKRPHWWPPTQGSGGKGNTGAGGYANNPWTLDNWNLTAQGRVISEKGRDFASKLAEAAGTTLGGPKPAK